LEFYIIRNCDISLDEEGIQTKCARKLVLVTSKKKCAEKERRNIFHL
jgi:hypothetical protein